MHLFTPVLRLTIFIYCTNWVNNEIVRDLRDPTYDGKNNYIYSVNFDTITIGKKKVEF